MANKYFGTDGIRDMANAGLLKPSVILELSQAFGEILRRRSPANRHCVGLGGDSRISLDMIRAAIVAGFTSMGSDVVDFGILPTPALAYLTRTRALEMGVMISASHNPMADNGIKVFDADGFKLPDEVEQEVERLLEDPNWEPDLPTGGGLGRVRKDSTGLEEYMTHLLGFCKGVSLDNLKVAVDCANGATCKMAPEVLTRLGAKVVVMANDPDGTNINLDCGSLYPKRLSELVVSEGCDLGVALDGDGDRSQFIDASGRILDGDHIMTALALRMKEQDRLNGSTLVATVMSNIGLEAALKKTGIRVERTPVGDRHVTARLKEGGYSLGGEQSGHIIFGEENNYTGDGTFTALKVLKVISETGRDLADLASVMVPFPQILINVEVSRKPPLEEMPSVAEEIRRAEALLGDEGRILFRYSGTERLARVMVEGRDGAQVESLAQSIADKVQSEIG